MRWVRQVAFALSLIGLLVSVILLLNFTAPNPTGRRYSSRMILTTGNPQDVGRDAEDVLAADLRLPNNNDLDQRQCLCGNQSYAGSRECNGCIAVSPAIDTYRIPDFVAPGFIAEAKNREGLPYSGRDADQISDFALVARELHRPLWLYVRADTNLDPQYLDVVQATGGGVVRYFATSGYIDAVDTAARYGLAVSVVVIGFLGLSGGRLGRFLGGANSSPGKPPSKPMRPDDPLSKAINATERAETFGKASKDRTRSKLDEAKSRDEFDSPDV
jgi:hypothetical protein